jgi:hypothetical protein
MERKTNIIDKWLKSTYRDKGVAFSATELLKPAYWLWLHKFSDLKDKIEFSEVLPLKSVIGSAFHQFIEKQDEIGVVKEFSYTKEIDVDGQKFSIGGTADELRWNGSKWQLGDIKTKSDYPYEKFLKGERDNEIMQLSIYRWLFNPLFDIDDIATIYLFNVCHTRQSKIPFDYTQVDIRLLSIAETEEYIKNKIRDVLKIEKENKPDCPYWLCDYCQAVNVCPNPINKKAKEKVNMFKNEE